MQTKTISIASSLAKETPNPLVSIIIPVYNTPEDLLRRCLDSAAKQTYKNIEVIIVDDGSNQDTIDALNEYVKQDCRFILVQGKHQGVSEARNIGLNNANGDWIAFADSDDELHIAFLNDALAIAQDSQADLICGNLQSVYSDTVIQSYEQAKTLAYQVTESKEEKKILSNQLLIGYRIIGNNFDLGSATGRGSYGKLFKKEIIKEIRFSHEVSIGEDSLFNYFIAKQSKSIAITNRVWYFYFRYSDSASSNHNVEPWINSMSSIVAELKDEDEYVVKGNLLFLIFLYLNNYIRSESYSTRNSNTYEILKFGNDHDIFSQEVYSHFKTRWWTKMFYWLARNAHYQFAYFWWYCIDKVRCVIRREKKIQQ